MKSDSANNCVERTGTRRLGQLQFVRQCRLVPAAHAHRPRMVCFRDCDPRACQSAGVAFRSDTHWPSGCRYASQSFHSPS